jgi:hypothetical protein
MRSLTARTELGSLRPQRPEQLRLREPGAAAGPPHLLRVLHQMGIGHIGCNSIHMTLEGCVATAETHFLSLGRSKVELAFENRNEISEFPGLGVFEQLHQ